MDKGKRGVLYLISILGVGILCCLLYDNIFHLDTRINSDFAAQIVLADVIKDTHQILPTEWNFSTEIHISFATLFSAVLLNFISDWTICYIISNILTYAILSVCIYRTCRFLNIGYPASLMVIIGILAPVSEWALYYFQIGNEYMTYAIYEFVFVILWIKLKDKHKMDQSSVLYIIWAFFLGTMGFRYVMTCFAPVIFVELYNFCKEGCIKSVNIVVLLGIGIGGIGILFNKYLLMNIFTVEAHTDRYFKDISDIPERMTRSLESIIELLGYVKNGILLSWQGMINILSLLFLVFLICVLVYCVNQSQRFSMRMRDYTYFVLFGFIVDAWIIIFTCEDENPLNDIRGKYFILSIILFGPLIVQYISCRKKAVSKFIVIVLCAYFILASGYTVTRNISASTKNSSLECINFLKEQNVLYGYSTFWQGNINQFYSDGEIVISPTNNFEMFDLLKHISSSRQYELVQEQKKYFIWLTVEENQNWKGQIQNIVKNYSNDKYIIYICEK